MLYFFIIIKIATKKIDQVYFGLFLTHGLVEDLLDVINPIPSLLLCCRFTHIVVMVPCVLMEDFHFSIGHLFAIFHTDKAIALVFNLSSVKEATNAEKTGLFGHSINQLTIKYYLIRIKRLDSNF